jgi:hypothetical protein
MDSDKKRFALILGGVLLGIFVVIPGGLILCFSLFWAAKEVPSKIIDFHPSEFEAKADSRFFYSIGTELRNSDEIDPHAPVLMRGSIKEFLVSPDRTKIAVVADGVLSVVGQDGSTTRRVTAVDSIYRGWGERKKPVPLGKQFFRDRDFQWTRDSQTLYLIKDEFYNSDGSQLYSKKGELWKYDLESGILQIVLKPFPAYSYFFGLSGIYFSVPTPQGDLRLRYLDGTTVSDVGAVNAGAIPVEALQANFEESPFFSFDIFDYQRTVLPAKGVRLVVEQKDGPQQLEILNRPYVTMTRGEGIKGSYYCSETLRSLFLPGDRYFLFNTPYCRNYNGQLLVDTVAGNYKRLPTGTVVYLTLNTETDPNYRVTSSGMMSW